MKDLNALRKKVDSVDGRILTLLNERTALSKAIGDVKRGSNQSIYSPEREREVLKRLAGRNAGPISNEALCAVYREIMSSSKKAEKPLQVAYLGPQFTYTYEAAQKIFGASTGYFPCAAIADVFTEVERGRCDYGVIPVENSTEGAVTYTLDMFIQSDLKIFNEMYLRISHHLLSKASSLKAIKNVYSNPQAFGQCRQWLEANLPNASLLPRSSTAEAADFVGRTSRNHRQDACIASVLAAKEYKLNVLAKSIEDSANNTTRFIVVSRSEARPTRKDRTSIVFELKDRVGALHDMLVPFKKARINMTKIESRPSKKKVWSYYFFVDFEGHKEDPRVKQVLKALERKCVFFKVMGSYPKAEA